MIGLASRLLWGIPILLGAVALLGADLLGWSDGYGLWILCLVFGTGATYEALSMLDHPQGFRRERRLPWIIAFYVVTIYGVFLTTSVGSVGFGSEGDWPGELASAATTLLGAVLLLGALVSTALSGGQKSPLWARVHPPLTLLWLSIPMVCTVVLAEADPVGVHLVLCTVLMVKGCDTGAYFIGRKFGKRPLHPVSPRKTIEGLIAGVLTSAVIGYLYAVQLADPTFSPGMALVLGVLVAVVGQISDLQESAMKRRAGRKDSGASIPGLGGALDMLDSLVLVMPLVLWWRVILAA